MPTIVAKVLVEILINHWLVNSQKVKRFKEKFGFMLKRVTIYMWILLWCHWIFTNWFYQLDIYQVSVFFPYHSVFRIKCVCVWGGCAGTHVAQIYAHIQWSEQHVKGHTQSHPPYLWEKVLLTEPELVIFLWTMMAGQQAPKTLLSLPPCVDWVTETPVAVASVLTLVLGIWIQILSLLNECCCPVSHLFRLPGLLLSPHLSLSVFPEILCWFEEMGSSYVAQDGPKLLDSNDSSASDS